MTTDTSDTAVTESTETVPAISMRILKRACANSLSNRSFLGYAIGCDDADAIYLSLQSNTAAGMFSKNWVAYSDIADALLFADKITSSTLLPLYANTSRNNAGFMLAVLLGEGLVCPFERGYQRQDFKPFLQQIDALIESGVDLGDAEAGVASAEETVVIERPAAKRGRPRKT